ncbi:MAG: BPSS1780 family membrane protein [Burkholderiales bacterium]
MEARQVTAGRGWQWIVEGFNLFRKSPVIWVVLFIILLLITIALHFIPVLGPLVLYLLSPVFLGGLLLGCQAQQNGEELEIAHLFAGFKKNANALIALGGVYLVGQIVILGVMLMLGGSTLLALIKGGQPDLAAITAAMGSIMLALLVALALYVPLAMALWFAPALAVFQDAPPVAALKASFNACLKNIIPFLVYGVVLFVLSILAALPFGLGLLVLLPVIFTSIYTGYRDIFPQ